MVWKKSCGGRTFGVGVRITVLILLLVGAAGAATLTVDDSGGADYTKVQDAIDNASAGDTILVYSGTYYEKVVVNKQIILQGVEKGSGMAVINAAGGDAITINANGVTLVGFNSKNADNGIKVTSNNNIIQNNNVSNNNNGIQLYFSSYNNLSSNTVLNNSNYGILLGFSSRKNTIYNNYFNNTNNAFDENTVNAWNNAWNITKTPGTNIVDNPYLGGNFWANPSGTGFSQTCTDNDGDGICDSSYALNSNNIDYLPLSMNTLDTIPPASITNLTNITYAQTYINWTWTDPIDVDFDHVEIYIDGNYTGNVPKLMQLYNGSGFAPDTEHTIATRTVDTSGNINQTWVNHTARTAIPARPPNDGGFPSPAIVDFSPVSPVGDLTGANRTFNITVNQTVNVTWYINGTEVFNQRGVTESSYENKSAVQGIWNVSAVASNTNGSTMQKWDWIITTPIVINITSPVNNSVNTTGYINVTVALDRTGTALLNWNGTNESMTGEGISFYKNKTGLLSGNYSFKVYANDSNGVFSESETRIITIVLKGTTTNINTNSGSISGGSSGGGGGGGAASGENYSNIEVKEKYDLHIFRDKITSYTFSKLTNPILFVNITGNVNAGETGTAVEVLRNTSLLVKNPPSGKVYKNINIWVGTSGFAVSRNIKDATITFRVYKSWLDENNIREVVLYRYSNATWTALPTEKVGEDDKGMNYRASTDHFSPFAIVGVVKEETILQPATQPTQATQTTQPAQTIQPTAQSTVSVEVTSTEAPPNLRKDWGAIVMVLVLVGLTVSLIFIKKKF